MSVAGDLCMSSIPVADNGHETVIQIVGCERDVEKKAEARERSNSVPQDRRSEKSSPVQADAAPQYEVPFREESPNGNSWHDKGRSSSASVVADATNPRKSNGTGASPGEASKSKISSSGECRQDRSEASAQPEFLHRTREIRIQQGVSVRSMARRMGIDATTYRRLENPNTDLTLSELARIQKALDVPLADLLVDRNGLSRPVEERAKLVKAMKTAVAIRDSRSTSRLTRMANMLCEQLIDLMPELKEVSGWPKFGARRGKNALGKALSQPIDMSALRPHDQ